MYICSPLNQFLADVISIIAVDSTVPPMIAPQLQGMPGQGNSLLVIEKIKAVAKPKKQKKGYFS